MILDAVLERMMDAVHKEGGVVNQVMGDGIMALFGAPAPSPTTPPAAAWPRSGCRRRCSATRARSARARGVDVQIRVG